MSNLDIYLGDGPRSFPATAHFPGALEGKTCADCAFLDPTASKKKGRCVKHYEMRGMGWRFERDDKGERVADWWSAAPRLRTILSATAACKYFEAKPMEQDECPISEE